MHFQLKYTTIAGKTVLINELSNKQYISLLKYITNDDSIGLLSEFNKLVDNLNTTITCIDQFLILCELRSVCIGDELQLQTEEFNGVIKLQIGNVIDKIKAVDLLEYYNFLPKRLTESTYSVEELLKDPNASELPAAVLKEFNTVMHEIDAITAKCNIIGENKRAGINAIPYKIFDNTLFDILKLFYKDNLLNVYQLMYKLSSKCNISIDQFLRLTPAESKIMMQFYIEEIKQQEEDAKKAMNQNGNVYNGK